jgi:hypothetical protein
MKIIILIIGLCFAFGQVLAQTNQIPTNSVAEKPLIIDGKIIKTAHVEKIQPDGLLVSYTAIDGSFGVKVFYFENFPKSVQKQYGYDPKKAADFEFSQKLENASVAGDLAAKDDADKDYIARRDALEAQADEEYRQRLLQERAIEAQEKAADAAMIQALNPLPDPPIVNVNVEQRTTIY